MWQKTLEVVMGDRQLEILQSHKDALAGSKIELEKAKQKAEQDNLLGTYWKGWVDGATPTIRLYEHAVELFEAKSSVFSDMATAKAYFSLKARELGVQDPNDKVGEMLEAFFV
jgi:hypothetical protein